MMRLGFINSTGLLKAASKAHKLAPHYETIVLPR